MRNLICRSAILAGAAALLLGPGTGVAAAAPGGPGTEAVLTFTPDSHAYGDAAGSQVFTLANTGDRGSGGVHVTLSGSAEFTITASTCRGNLHPGDSCTVTVDFAATSGAEATTTLKATGNPHAVPATAVLTGGTTPTLVDCTANPTTALQDAIRDAEPGEVLAVTGTCDGTFRIGKDLAITGRNGAILNGQHVLGVFTIVLTIASDASVTLNTLTITNGSNLLGNGGGISNDGTVTLNGSTVTGNEAGRGGGIYNNHGTVTLNDGSVSHNTSRFGGGIYNSTGTVTLNDGSTVSHNTSTGFALTPGAGGGISNDGTVTMNGSSTITENTADSNLFGPGLGGGIYNERTLVGAVAGHNVRDNIPDDIFPAS